MGKRLVYDWPTRVFHWVFACLFLFSFVVATEVDDESIVFIYHMLSGLVLCFLVLIRVIWGFVGTTYARFSNFAFNLLDLPKYFLGILKNSKEKWVGHNPATSWAALLMMVFTLGLGATGYLMTTSGTEKEVYEEWHEIFSDGFMVVVILHVLGVILHSVRHREMIVLSMLTGKKVDVPSGREISSSRPFVAIVMVVLVLLFSVFVFSSYDDATGQLRLLGVSLELAD